MGWTYFHKDSGKSVRETLQAEFHDCEIIAMSASINVAYAAMRNPKSDQPDFVFGIVFLLGYAKGSQYNFGYKDIDESMGPREDGCPENILNLLSEPAPNQFAIGWRARCRENILAKKARIKLSPGMFVQADKPLVIYGQRINYFEIVTVTPSGIGAIANLTHGTVPVRTSRQKLGAYTVLDEKAIRGAAFWRMFFADLCNYAIAARLGEVLNS